MVPAADNDNTDEADRERALAEAVRTACAEAARQAYNDAAIRGLCSEGAAEVAVGAVQALDLTPFIGNAKPKQEHAAARRHRESE